MKRIMITLCRDQVAPRFDLTTEVLLLASGGELPSGPQERKYLVLARASGNELCDLVLRMDVQLVVCGAIEEDFYHYLRWKRVELISNVSGPLEAVLERAVAGALQDGDSLDEQEGLPA